MFLWHSPWRYRDMPIQYMHLEVLAGDRPEPHRDLHHISVVLEVLP